MASDHIEFDCSECGQHILMLVKTNDFGLCSTCLMQPGWYLDEELRTILRYDGPHPPLFKKPE